MSEPKFDTEKPPERVTVVPVRAMNASYPEVRVSFGANPQAAAPFRDWLASPAAWEAFGVWYDSGGYRGHEET
jgi:hypothetical protein